MRERLVLTSVWLAGFGISLITIESYITVKYHGFRVLLPEDRLGCDRPLITLYASYLGLILAFWFFRPFSGIRRDHHERARFAIALVCTVIFNGIVMYFVALNWLTVVGEVPVVVNVKTGVTIAAWLSFLVAPANAYYFGTGKTP